MLGSPHAPGTWRRGDGTPNPLGTGAGCQAPRIPPGTGGTDTHPNPLGHGDPTSPWCPGGPQFPDGTGQDPGVPAPPQYPGRGPQFPFSDQSTMPGTPHPPVARGGDGTPPKNPFGHSAPPPPKYFKDPPPTPSRHPNSFRRPQLRGGDPNSFRGPPTPWRGESRLRGGHPDPSRGPQLLMGPRHPLETRGDAGGAHTHSEEGSEQQEGSQPRRYRRPHRPAPAPPLRSRPAPLPRRRPPRGPAQPRPAPPRGIPPSPAAHPAAVSPPGSVREAAQTPCRAEGALARPPGPLFGGRVQCLNPMHFF